MGEYSKRIGDVGEDVVSDFLKLIGWEAPSRNFDFPSINPEKHRRGVHSIDSHFHYLSPMISNTIENILISSKYSTNAYPTSPSAKFKEHYFDLAVAVESFKRSTILQETLALYPTVDGHFVRGLLFWLNNNSNSHSDDLYLKLSNIELPKEINHDGILLVDNKRIEFIYDTISYALLLDRAAKVDFIYFLTGLNNQDYNLRNGPILPVQYITTGILPLRIQNSNGETTVMISTIDPFDKNELIKLMGVAKNIGCNVQVNTIICFPNYLETEHLPIVNNVAMTYDSSFSSRLKVTNFSNPLLR